MNLQDFNKLDLKQNGEKTFMDGKFISSRDYYNQRLVLYSLYYFLVEVWYEPGSNTIGRIEGLSGDDKRIDRYIERENRIIQ
jgi:hypothetical protein